MSVACKSFVLSGRGLCVGLITRPEGSYLSVVFLSVIVKPRQRGGPGPLGAVAPWEEKIFDGSINQFVLVAIEKGPNVTTSDFGLDQYLQTRPF